VAAAAGAVVLILSTACGWCEAAGQEPPPRTQVSPAEDGSARPAPRNGATSQGAANGPLVVAGTTSENRLDLAVGTSTLLTTNQPFDGVSVAQPEVAEINALSPNRLLVTAKKPGTTQVVLWNRADSKVITVTAAFELKALQEQLRKAFPASKIDAVELNGSVMLRGQVQNQAVQQQAAQIAAPYGKVLNFLEVTGGKQIMLQVRVAEVSRSATSQLGINLGYTDGVHFGGSNIGQVSPLGIKDAANGGVALTVPSPNPAVTLFGTGAVGDVAFAYFIAALKQNNLLRILAEPNLIANSGEPAEFLAGGEFPIPVTQGGSGGTGAAITIEWREFGVRLVFTGYAMGDGRIRLKCAPEVSDLDFTTAVRFSGFVVPGLSQRKVNTTVELADGQTLAVAGLLNNTITATKDATPVLGELPVLGTLFRSVRYQRKETELVIFVTPRLVEAVGPDRVPAGPGEVWRHPTEKDLFLKGDIGAPVNAEKPRRREAPAFYGPHGFAPPPGEN
jgi:pilus assembly protein CpaC